MIVAQRQLRHIALFSQYTILCKGLPPLLQAPSSKASPSLLFTGAPPGSGTQAEPEFINDFEQDGRLTAGGNISPMAVYQDFSLLPDLLSSHKGAVYLALEYSSLVRVMWGFCVVKGIGGMEFPTDSWVEDGKISILSDLDAAFAVVQAEYPGRIGCGDLCQAAEGKAASADALIVEAGQDEIEAGEASGGRPEAAGGFLGVGVGCMVTADHIDLPLTHAFPQAVHSLLAADGRGAFGPGTVPGHVITVQEQIVGACLGIDLQAFLAEFLNDACHLPGRNVADADAGMLVEGKGAEAGNCQDFGDYRAAAAVAFCALLGICHAFGFHGAGVTANDPVTGEMVAPGDIEGQTRQALKNLKAILEEHGSDLEHVFKTLVFVADIDRFQEFNKVYKEFFPADPPARSTMQVGKFNHGMVIEIEAVAAVKG